jgi:hypothetical protein
MEWREKVVRDRAVSSGVRFYVYGSMGSHLLLDRLSPVQADKWQSR